MRMHIDNRDLYRGPVLTAMGVALLAACNRGYGSGAIVRKVEQAAAKVWEAREGVGPPTANARAACEGASLQAGA